MLTKIKLVLVISGLNCFTNMFLGNTVSISKLFIAAQHSVCSNSTCTKGSLEQVAIFKNTTTYLILYPTKNKSPFTLASQKNRKNLPYQTPTPSCNAKQKSLSINLAPLYFSGLAIAFHYINFDSHHGFRITALQKFDKFKPKNPDDYEFQNTINNFGIDYTYFIGKSKNRCRHGQVFVGPSLEYGTFYYGYPHGTLSPSFWGYTGTYTHENRIGYKTTLYIKANACNKTQGPFYILTTIGFGRMFFNEAYRNPDFGYKSPGGIGFSYLPTPPEQKKYANKWVLKVELNIGIRF